MNPELERPGAKDLPRHALWLRCHPCEHVWVAAWLPMEMNRVGKLLKGVRCPNCAAGPREIRLAREADIPKGDLRPPREPPDRSPTRQPERQREPKREPRPSRRKAASP